MYLVTSRDADRFRSFTLGGETIVFHPNTPRPVTPENLKKLLNDLRFWQLSVIESISIVDIGE